MSDSTLISNLAGRLSTVEIVLVSCAFTTAAATADDDDTADDAGAGVCVALLEIVSGMFVVVVVVVVEDTSDVSVVSLGSVVFTASPLPRDIFSNESDATEAISKSISKKLESCRKFRLQ